MKSRPYGHWTRQERESASQSGGRARSRGPGRHAARGAARERDRGRSRRASRGPHYGRILLVLAGVALVFVSVGLVFADVREAGNGTTASAGPKSEAMRLTVPTMERVRNVPVYGDAVGEEDALHKGTFHVEGTGFPWQEEANVYIAGHRIGYPRTDSFLVFWDLNRLKEGRRVVLTDAEDTKYVYEVFDRFVVGPKEVAVKKPVGGKNIVSLQTCTLPNYSERLIVQAELVRTVKAPVQQASIE